MVPSFLTEGHYFLGITNLKFDVLQVYTNLKLLVDVFTFRKHTHSAIFHKNL